MTFGIFYLPQARQRQKMNNFLREARKFRNISGNVCIILGNESCDLDSAVTSLSLAYYYYKNPDKFPFTKRKICNFLPIFNIPKNELPLKTEVTYFLGQNAIQTECITFKDEIEVNFLQNNILVLVDHHFSPFSESAVAVFDHRPIDNSSKYSENCYKIIDQVGSCSTLIANLYLQLTNVAEYLEPLKLLYGAIILDTVNFSTEADKAKPLDFKVAEKIEHLLNIQNIIDNRKKLFDSLVQARENVSSLDSYQILFKDMKLVSSKSNQVKIAFPGYPIRVYDYIKMNSAEDSIKRFAKTQNCSVIVLIGMKVSEGIVYRDIGVIDINNPVLFEVILEKLRNHQEPFLELEEYGDCSFLGGKFFKQKNIRASRKQILPMVKTILDKW